MLLQYIKQSGGEEEVELKCFEECNNLYQF